MALIIAAGLVAVGAQAGPQSLVLKASEQDGFTNDHAYNNSDKMLVCGREGYVAVWEFPLEKAKRPGKAVFKAHVSKVEKPGKVALYHMKNFNNGYAETQDYYAEAALMGEVSVEKPGEISVDVSKGVQKDAQGPGGFTSYYLKSEGAQIFLPSFESGKAKARIELSEA